ncbi:hypothetical protein P3W85_02960, partial [Cupriavidus basilensis]
GTANAANLAVPAAATACHLVARLAAGRWKYHIASKKTFRFMSLRETNGIPSGWHDSCSVMSASVATAT